MHLQQHTLRLSPTDLANHLACRHATSLDLRRARGEIELPQFFNPTAEVLRERGLAHEAAYVEHLRAAGQSIERIDGGGDGAVAHTLEAMRRGVDVIVQAALGAGRYFGLADVLRRVERESGLGAWSYEPLDTKLAAETRGGTILQLCTYADLLERMQGVLPAYMHVVPPPVESGAFEPRSYRVAEFFAFYRQVRAQLESFVDRAPDHAATYPDPVPHCDVCRWWVDCDRRRRADDHLTLTAGLGRLHARELNAHEITTLAGFAERATALDAPPSRGSHETYDKLHRQARIQLEGRRAEAPRYELLGVVPGFGLTRLPEPSPGDVFFDIEGDAFVDGGGLEYLLGVAFRDESGELVYESWQGLTRVGEKRAFERFIDFVTARLEVHPDLHVYHYHHYEPAASKRLMTRHATREDEVDRLLRGGRFVDLCAISKQSVRASVERYSLKDLEPFFGYERDVPLRDASLALRGVECALELGDEPDADALERVRIYNRDDCFATEGLRGWLEELRAEVVASGTPIERPAIPSDEPSENLSAWLVGVRALAARLTDGIPEDPAERTDDQRAMWLLAHLLEYFRRESKCAYWERVRLAGLDDDELVDERDAAVGLELVGTVEGGTARCPIHRYRYAPQETAIDEGDSVYAARPDDVGEAPIGVVIAADPATRTIDVRKRSASANVHPPSVFRYSDIPTHRLNPALLELAEWIADHGVDADGPFRAARDLLLALPPRRGSGTGELLQRDGDDATELAKRLVLELDGGILPIQGPPGTGKTFTGARMILELVRQGRTVGVTAVSHKVIRNLMKEVVAAGAEESVSVTCVHKAKQEEIGNEELPPNFLEAETNQEALGSITPGTVVGGTAWLWAHDDASRIVDTLFVDEAGQMSLAMVLSASRAAKNLVLLGDPRQLEQPQQAAHPEGSEVAALVHVLGGEETMPRDHGLFLDRTYRMAPPICAFTSEQYYEGRLTYAGGCEDQALLGEGRFTGAGLFVVPVEHDGNQSHSPEEVDAVARVVEDLRGLSWRNRAGEVTALDVTKEVLIVAPYNAQVSALLDRLPGMRIGTVDKFQGQQAAVVVYSMTTSSPEDAPRGMGFLYSPNRFNVATSRARCAVVLVANERLFEPECRTPEQMRWANGVCRFREMVGPSPS